MKMLIYLLSPMFGKTGVVASLAFLLWLNGGTKAKIRLKDLPFAIVVHVLLTVILKEICFPVLRPI